MSVICRLGRFALVMCVYGWFAASLLAIAALWRPALVDVRVPLTAFFFGLAWGLVLLADYLDHAFFGDH